MMMMLILSCLFENLFCTFICVFGSNVLMHLRGWLNIITLENLKCYNTMVESS